MPKGFAAIQEAADRIQRSSKFDDTPRPFQLKLGDKESAQVRFLEQGDDVFSYWYHDFSSHDKANGWRYKFPCLDQDDKGTPCPGCEQDLKRRFEGLINIIWRDAPKFKREDGKFARNDQNELIQEGNEDQVAIWRGGIELFTALGKKDVAFKGLASRDFIAERSGLKLDTKYYIEAADPDGGAKKLSAKDTKLAEEKYNLEDIANFKEYDEAESFIETILDKFEGGGDSEAKEFLAGKKSPFDKEEEEE